MQTQKDDINQRIAQGDADAYKELYQLYYYALCHFASNYLGDDAQAEDTVQDALLKLWEQRSRFAEIANLKSYLYLSVKNACLNHLTHQKVVAKHADFISDEINLLALQATNSAFDDEEISLEEQVIDAISNLPKQCSEIFKLKYLEGKRTKEIAEDLDISPRTVNAHIYNALKSLRNHFKDISILLILSFICFFDKYLGNF